MINDACQDEVQFKNDFEMISLFPNQYENKLVKGQRQLKIKII